MILIVKTTYHLSSCLQSYSFELSGPQNLHHHFTLNIVHVHVLSVDLLSLPTRVSSHRRYIPSPPFVHSHLRNHFCFFSSATTQYLRFSRDIGNRKKKKKKTMKFRFELIPDSNFHLNKSFFFLIITP